jgi:hypothetical protein
MWKEHYKRPQLQRRLPPYASINPRGEIVLNPTVYAALKGLNYVSLHYDDRTHHLAIMRPTGRGRIYKVRKFGRKGRLRVIRATRFLKHFGIDILATAVITDIQFSTEPDAVILSLRTATSIKSSIAANQQT